MGTFEIARDVAGNRWSWFLSAGARPVVSTRWRMCDKKWADERRTVHRETFDQMTRIKTPAFARHEAEKLDFS